MKTIRRISSSIYVAAIVAIMVAFPAWLPAQTAAVKSSDASSGSAMQWSVQVDRVNPGDLEVAYAFQVAIYENLLKELNKTKQFKQVFRDGDRKANEVPNLLVMKTTVETYTPGSETRRSLLRQQFAGYSQLGPQYSQSDQTITMGCGLGHHPRKILKESIMITNAAAKRQPVPDTEKLSAKYGCGPVHFSGTDEALYERHLLFDSGVDLAAATARDRFEALARSVRDVLSQRWLLTEKTYEERNPKRLYYLSMEFLIGRSLANNVTNLLLAPLTNQFIQDKKLNLIEILEQEPDAGLGNGGLGRLAACFIESAATMHLPAIGYGLRYEYGIFKQSIQHGWQQETPDNWLRSPDPWEIARPNEKVEVSVGCSFELSGGSLRPVPGRPTTLIGIPFDRPV